jgi:hypothetical protein
VDGIGQAREVVVALLDDAESEDGEVGGDNATTNGLPLAFARSSRSVAGVAVGEQQSNTRGMHHTLLHRKALLVVAAGDSEDVALELVAQAVARDFGAHSAFHEDAKLAFIVDLDQFLRPVGRVRDVELHPDDRVSRWKQQVGLAMSSYECVSAREDFGVFANFRSSEWKNSSEVRLKPWRLGASQMFVPPSAVTNLQRACQ